MNCERIREQIPEALAGRLEKAAREALVEHLEGCAGCRTEVAELNAAWRGLETLKTGMDAAPETSAKVRFQEMMAAYQAGMASVQPAVRHQRPLFHFFLHLTASRPASEDLVQEVFFRILKYRHTYQPEMSFRAWMFQIARNVHLDHAGRRKGEVDLPDEALELRGPEPLPDRQAQKNQEAVLLRRALAALPREKREVLIMSRFHELKYEEIASVLQCEVGTVKVRVYRAMRDLSDRFFALSGERAS